MTIFPPEHGIFGSASEKSAVFSYFGSTGNLPESGATALFFHPEGTYVYTTGFSAENVYRWPCSTPWDVTSITSSSYDQIYSTGFNIPAGLFFRPDGKKMYLTETSNDRIYSYSLSTAWDLTTITQDAGFFSASVKPEDFWLNGEGTKGFILNDGGAIILETTLSTPWDITTMTETGLTLMVDGEPKGITFIQAGTILYVTDKTSTSVYRWISPVPYDLSSFTKDATFTLDVGPQTTIPADVVVRPDGDRIYVYSNSGGRNIHQYNQVNA